ncbi:MAG TPA: HEAT repeat domain-containing protein, partial [Gemmataceae bacterium]|nr:HEAT repeat domain-containing protein [Gemmataceae bacterium]
MRRTVVWSVVILGALAPAARAESVEEWQVRGILTALKDGYPQVRTLALSELEDLLRTDAAAEWKGQSAALLNEARGDLREMLKDPDADLRAEAGRALARLYEHNKDVSALRDLLHDPEAHAGIHAAQALARFFEGTGDAAGLRDLLHDAEPNAPWYAAQALGRLYEKGKDASALRGLLADSDRNVRWYAARSLARLYEGTKDVGALRGLLKDDSADVRRESAAALARLGERDAEPVLRTVLRDKETTPVARREAAAALARLGDREGTAVVRDLLTNPATAVREQAAEALVTPAERGKDAAGLRDWLKDPSPEVRERAARALARLYSGTKSATALRDLLRDASPDARREAGQALAHLYETAGDRTALRDLIQSPDPDAAREAAWALVRLAEAEGDRTALRDFLPSPDSAVAREAAWALGRLGEKDVIPTLRDFLKDANADARRETARVLTRLGDTDLLAVLRIPYEDVAYLPWARWLAHYWGDRRPEVGRVLCAYLGRPKEPPTPPVTEGKTRREGMLSDIRVLREEAWEKTDSFWVREDVARWWSWLITQEGIDWKGADVAELRRVREALGSEPSVRLQAAAIDRALEPLEMSPSPLVRTVLVVVFLNVVAVLLVLLGRRLGTRSLWLPVGVCLAGMLVVVIPDVGGWDHRPHTMPWLLGVIAFAELGLLVGAGLISPGGVTLALPRVVTPRPGKSGPALDRHAGAVAARLRDDRDRTGYEEYVPLPADVRSESRPEPIDSADPAAVILARLTGADGPKGSVLIEAPAGTGKSALVREVVSRALGQFKADPTRPLPVLPAGGSGSVEAMIAAALAYSAEAVAGLLDAGRLLLVLDAASEAGPSAEVLAAFV